MAKCSQQLKILADSSLPLLDECFKTFTLKPYENYNDLKSHLPWCDILLCRANIKIDKDFLNDTNLKVVATASSGIDHIDTPLLQQKNIACFDAKGCNAGAVADYILSVLAYLTKKNRLKGQLAGIIGFGEVGRRVSNRLEALGFTVLCYDPYQDECRGCTLYDLKQCHLICVHPNLHQHAPFPSYHLLDENFLSSLENGTVIINASRGEIVDEQALIKMKHLLYCTDVYANEPHISRSIIEYAELCTPHIAGHSIEAKKKSVLMVAEKIHRYFNLPFSYHLAEVKTKQTLKGKNWIEDVLNVYDPLLDTICLKEGLNKPEVFLKLRQAHQFRHDYVHYPHASSLVYSAKILGFG